MLCIYNTMTRKKEEFKSINKDEVGIYICGVTVYDNCHIGHARAYIAFDMIIRYLKFIGYKVKFVRNITDIDDKIIKRSIENNEKFDDLTNRYISNMHNDFAKLGLLAPDYEPRATQYMPQMIELIQKLIDKGFAYKADNNGDVFYHVKQFKNYGKVSNKKIEDLQSGNRVDVNLSKKDPHDFVLWKMSKDGEPYWESPWGKGRPGWHLECSAMAMDILGETFDIHGGGFDLMFPHHENECAQSEAASGKDFVKYWMHAGFLQINKEKMSKSLNNFSTICNILEEVNPESLRYFMLSGHYRSPLEYSFDKLELAHSSLERMYTSVRDIKLDINNKLENSEYEANFKIAMDDDFNTPKALAVLFDLVRDINKLKEESIVKAQKHANLLKYLSGCLGILQQDPNEFFQKNIKVDANLVEELIVKRNEARKNKDWAAADKIRDKLNEMNIILEDKNGVTTWRQG